MDAQALGLSGSQSAAGIWNAYFCREYPMSATQFPRSSAVILGRVLAATTVGLAIAMGKAFGMIRVLTDIDPWLVMKSTDPVWLCVAVLLFVFGNLLVGHRFVALFPWGDRPRPNRWAVGSLFFAGSVFSLLLPGPVGELAAVGALKKRHGIGVPLALATAIHSRFVGLAAAATLAVLTLPLVSVDGVIGEILRWSAVILVSGGLGLGVVSSNPEWLQTMGRRLLALGDRPGLVGKALRSVRLFAVALTEVSEAPILTWLVVFGWSLVIQGVHILALFAVSVAVGVNAAWPGLILAQGTGSLAILVGMFLPGGLGTFELAFVGSLTGAGGVGLVGAGIMVVGVRVVHLLGLGCAGIFFAAWAKVFLSQEVQEVVTREPSPGSG
jgi:uncharacterized membrane protein YbhN (UPF0104 family)